MQIFRKIENNLLESSSLALGFFDGVHIGHQKVIKNAIEKAKETNSTPTVVTFVNHPIELLWDVKPEFITTLDERLALLEKQGIEAVLLLDFTSEIANKSAEEYLKEILVKSLNPKHITVGFNHHFGADKDGSEKFLKDMGSKYGYDVSVISPVTINGDTISSSLIRTMIKEGKTFDIIEILGSMYSITNKVIHGEKRGQKMGYPTANLLIPKNKIIPAFGVYCGIVEYQNNNYKAIMNIGKRPTFSDLQEPLVEVHLLDFDKDIYDETIKVYLHKKIRDEQKFDNVDQLKKQIILDYEQIQQIKI